MFIQLIKLHFRAPQPSLVEEWPVKLPRVLVLGASPRTSEFTFNMLMQFSFGVRAGIIYASFLLAALLLLESKCFWVMSPSGDPASPS